MIWFLVLSLVPLMFVTGYSLVKYEQAIDNELVQRLRANVREFVSTVSEYEKYLQSATTPPIGHLAHLLSVDQFREPGDGSSDGSRSQ